MLTLAFRAEIQKASEGLNRTIQSACEATHDHYPPYRQANKVNIHISGMKSLTLKSMKVDFNIHLVALPVVRGFMVVVIQLENVARRQAPTAQGQSFGGLLS